MNGASLRDAFERLLAQNDADRRGAVFYLSGGRIDRTELTVEAVRMALIPRATRSPGVNMH
jgi:non-canonical (house-cleaning) NTP pyrophosphatase